MKMGQQAGLREKRDSRSGVFSKSFLSPYPIFWYIFHKTILYIFLQKVQNELCSEVPKQNSLCFPFKEQCMLA